MTRERAKELLPIIKAYSEGKDIQYRSKSIGDRWNDHIIDSGNLSFHHDSIEYRIKPEPREFWVKDGLPSERDCVVRCATSDEYFRSRGFIHVREVID